MSPTKPGRVAARQRAERQWLAWLDLRRYQRPPADRIEWAQHLAARSRLARGDWHGDMPWERLRTAPMQVGFLQVEVPTSLSVRDIAWRDARCLRPLFRQPELRDRVEDWKRAHGHRTPGDFLLLAIFRDVHAPIHGPALHPLLLEKLGERSLGAQAYRRLFEQAQSAGLVVDLRATDARLIAGFTEWLRERRTQMRTLGVDGPERFDRRPKKQRKVHGTPDELQKWHQARVLPYLDIQLLAGADGRPMPSREIVAEVLFPGHGAGAMAFLKDHTLPLVRLLSQPHVVDGLVADGAAQKLQAEKSP